MSNQVQKISYDKVIEQTEKDFCAVAPSTMSFQAERSFALQHLQNNDYLMKVAQENPISLGHAIKNVAQIGLSLNPAKKQAYLIPRNLKSGGKWVSKVFLEPSYMGLCDLATMSGSIKWVQANVVHAEDKFEDNGPGERPTHKYDAFAKPEARGEFVGVYCVAKTADGDYLTTIMPADEVVGIRDRSESWKAYKEQRAKTPGPWGTDFNEQAKKTVVRRAFKMWPKTETLDRMAMAVQLSNENEGFEPIKTAPSLGEYTAEQKAYFDQMIEKSDSMGMFLFLHSLRDTNVPAALFNSFEKGTITKYKDVVRTLERKGQHLLIDCVASVNDSAEQSDHSGIAEVFDDLPDDAIEYIKEQCSAEAQEVIREMGR